MASRISGIKSSVKAWDVMNAIRNESSSEYQSRIPVATQENITKIGNAFEQYEPMKNEFLHALVNRIGLVIVKNALFNNPLREFKKELAFGTDVEEIFVDIVKAQTYDPSVAESEVFKRELPNVKALFHRQNRRDFYKVTIENEDLTNAFLSWEGVTDLIAKITNALYTSASYDEFILMKNLLKDYNDRGLYYNVQVDEITDTESAKRFAKTVRAYSNKLTFMSTLYNAQHVATSTPLENQMILIDTDLDAEIDVEVLAWAFNMSKADYLQRRVLVDNFGGMTGTYALIVDKDFFMVFDQKFMFTEQYNAQGLYWNYFLHIWQILSTSQFANAIRFTTDTVEPTPTPSVTSVTISPKTATVTKGGTQQFTTTVVVENGASQNVSYRVIDGSEGTTITPEGLLTVGANETATTLTVTAVSVFDSGKSDSATITVQE